MPSLCEDDLNQIIDRNLYQNFVETGTHIGTTIFAMQSYFNKLYTVELTKSCVDWCIEQNKNENTKFYNGSSESILPEIIKELDGPTIFFLDAHYSGGDTSHGNVICPIYEELEIIMKLKHKCIIIIDDFRDFNTSWMPVTKEGCLKIVKDRIVLHYHISSILHSDDRFILYLK